MVPPELVIAGVTLIVLGVGGLAVYRITRAGAVARDDLKESRTALDLVERARIRGEQERARNEDL